MELAVKLEAALVAWLQNLDPSPYPAYFDPATQIKPGEADEDIEIQYLRARSADQAEAEFPLATGNFWYPCELEVRTPAEVQTTEETSQLAKHQAIAAILEAAFLVDDLPAQLNAVAATLGAGYELTVFDIQDRVPARVQDSDAYSSGWTFRVYCCSKTIAA